MATPIETVNTSYQSWPPGPRTIAARDALTTPWSAARLNAIRGQLFPLVGRVAVATEATAA